MSVSSPQGIEIRAGRGRGRVVELHNIVSLSKSYVFTTADPYLLIEFDEPLAAGWHTISFGIEAPVRVRPRVYLESDGGYPEATAFNLKRVRPNLYSSYFRSPVPFRRLRLDPADFKLRATFGGIEVRPLGKLELAAAAVKAARQTLQRGPKAFFGFIRSAIGTVLNPNKFDSFGSADTVGVPPTPELRALDSRKRYEHFLALDRARDAYFIEDVGSGAVVLDPERRFHVVVPVPAESDPAAVLPATLASLPEQFSADWQATILFAGRSAADIEAVAAGLPALQDPRVRTVAVAGDLLAAALKALADERFSHACLLPPGMVLSVVALATVSAEIGQHPDAAVFYFDDDFILEGAARRDGRFKPDWSPALFQALDYLGPAYVFSTEALRRARVPAAGPAPLTAAILALASTPGAIRHIGRVLGHHVVAADAGGKADAAHMPSGAHVWETAADRADVIANVLAEADAAGPVTRRVEVVEGRVRVTPRVKAPAPLASILIPTRDRLDLLRPCVESILRHTDYPNYEVVIVDNGSQDPATLAWFSDLPTGGPVRVVAYPHPFNYSAINNFAVEQSRGEVMVLLNNDTEVLNREWLDELVGWAMLPDVGAVGAKLYFPSGLIQHGGVALLSLRGVAGHLHLKEPGDAEGYMGRLRVPQDLSAVTAACMAVRKSVYRHVGGLNEIDLAVAFNDIDFCLRLRDAGYRVVWTPHAQLTHYESESRGQDLAPAKRARFLKEVDYMARRWGEALETDPFYAPHFERGNANFILRHH